MRIRKHELGEHNCIGKRVELARKGMGMKQKELLAQIQVSGIDMSASALSKLEGQVRHVYDYELRALSEILGVTPQWLMGMEEAE